MFKKVVEFFKNILGIKDDEVEIVEQPTKSKIDKPIKKRGRKPKSK